MDLRLWRKGSAQRQETEWHLRDPELNSRSRIHLKGYWALYLVVLGSSRAESLPVYPWYHRHAFAH